MLKLWNIVVTIAVRTTGLLDGAPAPVLALAWILSNLARGWIGIAIRHPNLGALTAGALDGTIFSAIVLVKASARPEAGMTGLLSGFGLDSITSGVRRRGPGSSASRLRRWSRGVGRLKGRAPAAHENPNTVRRGLLEGVSGVRTGTAARGSYTEPIGTSVDATVDQSAQRPPAESG